MVTGPIAVSYNVKGVDKLVLTPEVVAKIFTGKITTWNDPAIAQLNSGVTLPGDADQGLLPLRRVGHDRELHQVPQRRRCRGLDRPSPARSGPARAAGQGEVGGCRRRRQGHRGWHRLRRVVLRQGQQAWASPRSTTAPARSS